MNRLLLLIVLCALGGWVALGFADSASYEIKPRPALMYLPLGLPVEVEAPSGLEASKWQQGYQLGRGLAEALPLAAETTELLLAEPMADKNFDEKKLAKYLADLQKAYTAGKAADVFKQLDKLAGQVEDYDEYLRDIAAKRGWQVVWLDGSRELPYPAFQALRRSLGQRGQLPLMWPEDANRADFALELAPSLVDGEGFFLTDIEMPTGLRQLVLEGTSSAATCAGAWRLAVGEGLSFRQVAFPALQTYGLRLRLSEPGLASAEAAWPALRALEISARAGHNSLGLQLIGEWTPEGLGRLEAILLASEKLGLTPFCTASTSLRGGSALKEALERGDSTEGPRLLFAEAEERQSAFWQVAAQAVRSGVTSLALPAIPPSDEGAERQLFRSCLDLSFAVWNPFDPPSRTWYQLPSVILPEDSE